MIAWLNLRHPLSERREAFAKGLKSLGFNVVDGLTMNPGSQDIYITWNRIGVGHLAAEQFERRGLPVIVCENASWGNDFAGKEWLTLAKNWHNRSGRFPVGGPERWDSLNVMLAPWRDSGETVILPQRGIGVGGMPKTWPQRVMGEGRVRPHPGQQKVKPLSEDLAHCGKVITWGSGAAIKALMWGIPVESHMADWIGTCEPTDADRLRMLRELAWSQWTLDEIRTGYPFQRLLTQ